jgi:hypothetical protein
MPDEQDRSEPDKARPVDPDDELIDDGDRPTPADGIPPQTPEAAEEAALHLRDDA